MVESLSSVLIKSKELDTSEVRWERKSGSVLAIYWCAVFVSSKTKNVISSLNTHLTKLDNLKLLMKYLKICRSVKMKDLMMVKAVLSFWITLVKPVLMTQVQKVNQRVNQMRMTSVLTKKATALKRNSSKSILIISDLFLCFYQSSECIKTLVLEKTQ